MIDKETTRTVAFQIHGDLLARLRKLDVFFLKHPLMALRGKLNDAERFRLVCAAGIECFEKKARGEENGDFGTEKQPALPMFGGRKP